MGQQQKQKTNHNRAIAQEKRAKALELRKQGATLDTIAREVGYSDRAHACRAVMQGLRELIREPGEEVIKLELEYLDGLLEKHYPAARMGDMDATDRVLRIMERRAKYLGLDKVREGHGAPIIITGEAMAWVDQFVAQGNEGEGSE